MGLFSGKSPEEKLKNAEKLRTEDLAKLEDAKKTSDSDAQKIKDLESKLADSEKGKTASEKELKKHTDRLLAGDDPNVQGMNAKDVVRNAADKKMKIRRSDRMLLKVIKGTKHYKVNQIIEPAEVYGKALIENEIAVKYTAPEPEKEDSEEED